MFPKHSLCLWDVQMLLLKDPIRGQNVRQKDDGRGWLREIIFESAFFGSLKLGVNNRSNWSLNLELVRHQR